MTNYFIYGTPRSGSTLLFIIIDEITKIKNSARFHSEFFKLSYGIKDEDIFGDTENVSSEYWYKNKCFYHIPYIENDKLYWDKSFDKNINIVHEHNRRIDIVENNNIFFKLHSDHLIDINKFHDIKDKYQVILIERKNKLLQYLSLSVAYHTNITHYHKTIPNFNLNLKYFQDFMKIIDTYENTKNYFNIYDTIYYEDLIVHKEKILKFKSNYDFTNHKTYNYIPGRYKKENFINLEEAIDWFKDSPYKNQIDEMLNSLD